MRHIETIDQELRLLAAVWWAIREGGGGRPDTNRVDNLLDERLAITKVSAAPRAAAQVWAADC